MESLSKETVNPRGFFIESKESATQIIRASIGILRPLSHSG